VLLCYGQFNFTRGGFADNTELNICIEGRTSDPFFRQVRAFIDEQERQSQPISTPEIDDYREQFERLKASRARLAKFRASENAENPLFCRNVALEHRDHWTS
jgi:hypothetical protein